MPDASLLSIENVQQSDRLLHMPILMLHVHSRCNCRCAMCDIWKRDENTELTLEALERQRNSLLSLGVEQVVFTGGEPLMHQQLPELIQFFQQLNIRLTILTSGLLLSRYADTVVSGFRDVIVSLDGPDAVHDQIRGVKGAFAKLAEGVAAIKRLSPAFPIHARCTVQRANFSSLAATVKAAADIGLDGISFLAADLSSSAFNRELIWPVARKNAVSLDENDVVLLKEQFDIVEKMRSRVGPHFTIAESRGKLKKILNHFKAEAGLIPHRAPRCNAPWISGVWEVDGTVRPCFFHQPVGNLSHQSLEEAVNSDAALQFRSHLRVDQDEVCQRCVCSLNYRAGKPP